MSPADERRRLVQAAQRREPFASEEWFGNEPSARSSLYTAARPAKNRGWTFVAVSAALVVGALGVCWLFASSGSFAQWTNGNGERAATTEVTSAPTDKPVDVAALPNAPTANAVPTTVQPASVPAAPPILEEAPKVAPAAPVNAPAVAATTGTPVATPNVAVTSVRELPAAPAVVHHEPAGPTTLRVVETPDPEPTPATESE